MDAMIPCKHGEAHELEYIEDGILLVCHGFSRRVTVDDFNTEAMEALLIQFIETVVEEGEMPRSEAMWNRTLDMAAAALEDK